VPEALVAPDLDLPLDVLGHVPAEVTLDLEVPVDVLPDPDAPSFGSQHIRSTADASQKVCSGRRCTNE